MDLSNTQSLRVTVVNPETPFGGVQIVGVSSNGEGPDVPDIVVGVTDFLSLNDTPDTYEGQAGKLVAVNNEETALEFITRSSGGEGPDSGGGSGIDNIQNGITSLVNGQSFIDVTFPVAQPNASWLMVECSIVNKIDPIPINILTGILTSKADTGFRLQLSGVPDSGNYELHWASLSLVTGEVTVGARITTSGDTRITTSGDLRII